MQSFERPAVFYQRGGQPIEQLRMRGLLSQHAKISRRGHQPAAKMVQPNTVGQHAGNQRVGFISEPPPLAGVRAE